MSVAQQQSTAIEPYLLPEDAGVADVWWPFSAGVGRYTTKVAAEQTAGRLFQLLVDEPHGAAPPLHIHHDADETFYVLHGDVTFFAGDERIDGGAGDYLFVPKLVPHTYLVQSQHAVMLVTFSPAGIEGFFAELGTPVVPGAPQPRPAAPDPEDFARRAMPYGIEILGPPPTLD